MLNDTTKRKINSLRQILVGKVPDPKSQVDQITNALIYKYMDDMDRQAEIYGGKAAFFMGEYEKYSWRHLMDPKLGGQERLNLYVEALEKMSSNPNLSPVFRDILKGAFLPYRSPETLNLFLTEIDGFSYDHSEELGNAFEYLLSIMGSQGDAGQFRTPRHIIDFIVEVVDPKKDEKILDPACGTAGFLISAYKHVLKSNQREQPGDRLKREDWQKLHRNFSGYDIDPGMIKLSRTNMFLHSFPEPKISEYDTLSDDSRWDETFDVILANPPFMTPKGGIIPHKRFGISANRAEVLFVDYIVEHLKPKGRAGIIVPEGIIFQSANAYKSLRKKLVEDGLFAVVSLPSGVFQPYSGVKTSILLFDNEVAKKSEDVLFIKIQNDGFDPGAQRRPIDKDDLPKALEVLKTWRETLSLPEESDQTFAHVVSRSKIVDSGDYNLSGDRYRAAVDHSHAKWPMVELGNEEHFSIESGGTPDSKDESYWNGDVRWVTLADLPSENRVTEIWETKRTITRGGLKNSSAKVLPRNSILISSRATIGRVAINRNELATNQGFKNIVIKNFDKTDPEFVAYAMTGLVDEMMAMASGGTFKEISKSSFCKLKIPLPPIEIQKQIVAELDGYQGIIAGAKQIVKNWKPKIDIDPEWEKVKLGDVTKLMTGGTPLTSKKEYYGGDIKWLVSGDINQGEIFDCEGRITELALKESNARLLPKDSVLIALNGQGKTRGTVAVLRTEAACNQSIVSINPEREKLLPEFLLYVLKGTYQEIRDINGDNQRGGLNMPIIRGIEIPLPPLTIQKQIVEKIEAERTLVESAKKLIEIYEQKTKETIAKLWNE